MTTPSKPYPLAKRHRAKVQKQHRTRTLNDLDATAKLSWNDEGTASWEFDGGIHTITVNENIGAYINTPKMLSKREQYRGEGFYASAVHLHEVGHGLYTSRDFDRVNKLCKKLNVPFIYVNMGEDARMEGLMRRRRPFKVAKNLDLDFEGYKTVKPDTYGVRKFEWHRYDELAVDTPDNAFLSFVKCEGTKVHLDRLRKLFIAKHANLVPWVSGKTGDLVGFELILAYWRKLAGRGADLRFPTTESIVPLMADYLVHFPAPKCGGGGGGGFGPIGDYVESAKKAGVKPHGDAPTGGSGGSPTKPTPPTSPSKTREKSASKDGRKTWKGKHDHKRGGTDESTTKLTKAELKKRGLSEHYFEIEFLN